MLIQLIHSSKSKTVQALKWGCQTYGPRAYVGPLGGSIRPAWWIFECKKKKHKQFIFVMFFKLYFMKYNFFLIYFYIFA